LYKITPPIAYDHIITFIVHVQIHDANVYGHSNRIGHEVSGIQERSAQRFSSQVRRFFFFTPKSPLLLLLHSLNVHGSFIFTQKKKKKIGTAWFRGATPLKWPTWPYAIRLTKRTIAKSETDLRHQSDGFRGRAFYW
jgi:hypothetical protein